MAQASVEKLEHTGPAEKERVASVPQKESNWQVRRSRLCQKEKEQSRQSKAPDCKGGGSQGRDRSGACRGIDGFYSEGRQIPRRGGRASKESLPRRSRRKHKRVSGRKNSPGGSAQSGFTPSLVKPKMGKKVGRQRARSQDDRTK